jgi:hypothetical protein
VFEFEWEKRERPERDPWRSFASSSPFIIGFHWTRFLKRKKNQSSPLSGQRGVVMMLHEGILLSRWQSL